MFTSLMDHNAEVSKHAIGEAGGKGHSNKTSGSAKPRSLQNAVKTYSDCKQPLTHDFHLGNRLHGETWTHRK